MVITITIIAQNVKVIIKVIQIKLMKIKVILIV
jgi:hypothetical protein